LYPDLSYLFHDLFGTAPDNWLSIFKTFGLFLLFAFLVSAGLLRSELLRRQALGQFKPNRVTIAAGSGITVYDYLFNGLFGFVLGYKIPYAIANFSRWQQDPGSVLLSGEGFWWSGLLVAAGFLAYYYSMDRREKDKPAYEKDMYPSDRVGPITMLAALGGIIGAKVVAILDVPQNFINDPVGTLLSGDGLAIYGGLIGGALFVFFYLRKRGINAVPVMDAVAPALIVGYGVGRMGCQLSGDGDWGTTAGPQPGWWFLPDWVWAFDFPHNVLRRGVVMADCELEYCTRLAEAVHPTSVYETAMAFMIGGILWALRKRLTALPGALFSVYLMFNGVERFFIEFARINTRKDFLGFALSQAQIIAICFVLAGLIGMWLSVRAAREKPLS